MPKEHWLLDVLRGEIDPKNEANTSRYVHEVLRHCLEWPFESIRPQSSKRGFIDYELRHENGDRVHVEVKPINTRLKDDMIRKYLSSRTRSFDIGVLTNLSRWRILAAGYPVKKLTGQSIVCIYDITLTKREHIGQISNLIGYRGIDSFMRLRQLFSEKDEVLNYLLCHDSKVLSSIRRELKSRTPTIRVPRNNGMTRHMRSLLRGSTPDAPDLEHRLRYATCSAQVAESLRCQLESIAGASVGQRTIQQAIKRLVAGDI